VQIKYNFIYAGKMGLVQKYELKTLFFGKIMSTDCEGEPGGTLIYPEAASFQIVSLPFPVSLPNPKL
jgi:hypothetical protein